MQAVTLQREVNALETGEFENGTTTGIAAIARETLRNRLFERTLRPGLARVNEWSTALDFYMRVPASRLAETFGSYTNSRVFTAAESSLNNMKGRLAAGNVLIGKSKLKRLVTDAAAGNTTAQEELGTTFDTVSVTIE